MRIENRAMQDWLKTQGIEAQAKYFWTGSTKHSWRLSAKDRRWTQADADKLNSLGFTQACDGKPLNQYSGNGGYWCVFVIGHNEFAELAEKAGSI